MIVSIILLGFAVVALIYRILFTAAKVAAVILIAAVIAAGIAFIKSKVVTKGEEHGDEQ